MHKQYGLSNRRTGVFYG